MNCGEVFTDLTQACNGAAALLVLTNHRRYEEFLPTNLNLKVLDVWQVCKKMREKNFPNLYTLGNLMLDEEAGKCGE
ncbi:MAG: hypothetical protein IJQ16_05110 [Selenomonadaceae bacterium]|nr:hypothetical protein [Selenomonadaceae bacterium]